MRVTARHYILFGYRERSSGRPDAIELVTLNHRIQILGNILRVQKIIAILFVNLEMFLKTNSSSKFLCNLTSMAPEFHCCFFDVQIGGDFFGMENAIITLEWRMQLDYTFMFLPFEYCMNGLNLPALGLIAK